MTTHYTLLGIPPTAPPEEVKRAFRREVARYHPDKVQHLGPEFQELATMRSAALTEAYRVLIDADLRREYDEQIAGTPDGNESVSRPDLSPSRETLPRTRGYQGEGGQVGRAESGPKPQAGRPNTAHGTGLDLVKRAVLMKVRDAAVAQGATTVAASSFDAVYQLKGRRPLFRTGEAAVTVAVRIVPTVEPASVEAAWPAALRCRAQGEEVCLLLLGSGIAPPRDLGGVISELRRKSRGSGPVVVPVDIRDWQALLPPETPASVRSLLDRIRTNH